MKTALISGITGQDGSYLAEYLLNQGATVHGIVRRTSESNRRIAHLKPELTLHETDLTDRSSISRLVLQIKPDEIYNLAAQSFVGVSWDCPAATAEVNGIGAVNLYEAARLLQAEYGQHPRVYQASTSEMFGNAETPRQNELTPFRPRSPYGCAKLYAHEMARVYRESFDLFISCGILFNHESPRRGEEFVTRKITKGVAEIANGDRDYIALGNLDARRDWGFAKDYVKAMVLMLRHTEPEDFVIGTGESYSVRDFLDAAFAEVGITDWENHVRIDPKFYRPAELHTLCADPAKAEDVLGWKPETPFRAWVAEMVKADMETFGRHKIEKTRHKT